MFVLFYLPVRRAVYEIIMSNYCFIPVSKYVIRNSVCKHRFVKTTTLLLNVIFVFRLQSTPVGSLQTGQEIIVSPNRDRHPYKVRVRFYFDILFFLFSLSLSLPPLSFETNKPKKKKPRAWLCEA